MMTLKYSLAENRLVDQPDIYSAVVHPATSIDMEAAIMRILGKGTLLTRTDVVAVLNAFNEVLRDGTSEGCTFNLPMFNTSFSISGVFEGPLDSFDENRHRLNVNLTKGTVLREAEKNVRLEKTVAAVTGPQIQEVKDCVSGSINDRITAGGVIELRGYSLKIDGDDPDCGLWLVAEDGTLGKVPVLIENKPSRIIAMIPAKPQNAEGELPVSVKIVTQYSGGSNRLKVPRTVTFQKTLTLA